MKDIALELTKTLGSYNKTVNKTVNGMNKSLMAIHYVFGRDDELVSFYP